MLLEFYDFSCHMYIVFEIATVSMTVLPGAHCMLQRAHWRQHRVHTHCLLQSPSTSSPPAHTDCINYQSLEIDPVTDHAQTLHSIASLGY